MIVIIEYYLVKGKYYLIECKNSMNLLRNAKVFGIHIKIAERGKQLLLLL